MPFFSSLFHISKLILRGEKADSQIRTWLTVNISVLLSIIIFSDIPTTSILWIHYETNSRVSRGISIPLSLFPYMELIYLPNRNSKNQIQVIFARKNHVTLPTLRVVFQNYYNHSKQKLSYPKKESQSTLTWSSRI